MIEKLKADEVWIQEQWNNTAVQPTNPNFSFQFAPVKFQEWLIFQKINEIIDKLNTFEKERLP